MYLGMLFSASFKGHPRRSRIPGTPRTCAVRPPSCQVPPASIPSPIALPGASPAVAVRWPRRLARSLSSVFFRPTRSLHHTIQRHVVHIDDSAHRQTSFESSATRIVDDGSSHEDDAVDPP